jgi:hypothetical protein
MNTYVEPSRSHPIKGRALDQKLWARTVKSSSTVWAAERQTVGFVGNSEHINYCNRCKFCKYIMMVEKQYTQQTRKNKTNNATNKPVLNSSK